MDKTDKTSCSMITKRKLADALKELMNTTSFDKITVSDITEKCNIHRQTFYYHFQDRYDLLDWLIYDELLSPLMDGFNLDTMYEKFYDMFTAMSNDKSFYKNAIKINSDDLNRFISSIAIKQLIETMKNIKNSVGIDNTDNKSDESIAEFFGYGISGVTIAWVQKGMKETPMEMVKRIEHIVDVCKELVLRRDS